MLVRFLFGVSRIYCVLHLGNEPKRRESDIKVSNSGIVGVVGWHERGRLLALIFRASLSFVYPREFLLWPWFGYCRCSKFRSTDHLIWRCPLIWNLRNELRCTMWVSATKHPSCIEEYRPSSQWEKRLQGPPSHSGVPPENQNPDIGTCRKHWSYPYRRCYTYNYRQTSKTARWNALFVFLSSEKLRDMSDMYNKHILTLSGASLSLVNDTVFTYNKIKTHEGAFMSHSWMNSFFNDLWRKEPCKGPPQTVANWRLDWSMICCFLCLISRTSGRG